jgi:hypothetical protein
MAFDGNWYYPACNVICDLETSPLNIRISAKPMTEGSILSTIAVYLFAGHSIGGYLQNRIDLTEYRFGFFSRMRRF